MSARNVFYLGVKELRSLLRDPILLGFIAFAFTFNIYTAATAVPETLHNAPVATVDGDRSALSHRIVDAFAKTGGISAWRSDQGALIHGNRSRENPGRFNSGPR
jgi:hypothetical protein